MRKLFSICCLFLCISAVCAVRNVPAMAGDGFSLSQSGENMDAEYNALAAKPYRPSWAPLPVFHGSGEMVPLVQEILKSDDAASRGRAAFLLGQIGYRGSADLLVKGLKDPDRSVRVQCGVALACMGDERGIPVCAAVFGADEDWIRCYAAYGLWCVNGVRAKRILSSSLNGQGVLVTRMIRGALDSPAVPLPVIQLPQGVENSKLTVDDVLADVSDIYTRESEWWWHEGDYEQGIRCLGAQVFMDPSDIQSYALAAWLQRSLNRPDEAVRTLRRMVSANPDEPEAHFEIGQHYMNTKDYVHAEESLRRAVELGGDNLMRRMHAHSLEKLGRLKESFAEWEDMLREFPNEPAVQYNHGRVKALLDAESGK